MGVDEILAEIDKRRQQIGTCGRNVALADLENERLRTIQNLQVTESEREVARSIARMKPED
jgi:hypothetical protein